jgi:hypothetical protein
MLLFDNAHTHAFMIIVICARGGSIATQAVHALDMPHSQPKDFLENYHASFAQVGCVLTLCFLYTYRFL